MTPRQRIISAIESGRDFIPLTTPELKFAVIDGLRNYKNNFSPAEQDTALFIAHMFDDLHNPALMFEHERNVVLKALKYAEEADHEGT